MIRSMTGFGRGERRVGSLTVGVEIRSVNHRHAELRVKLPAALAAMEDPLRRRLASAVTRGRVDATVSISGLEEPVPVEINHALVAAYLRAAGEVASRHSLGGTVSLESVLSLPGVVSLRAADGSIAPDQEQAVAAAFGAAVEDLQRARTSEGKHLAAEVERRLRGIEKHRLLIERRAKGAAGRYAKRLAARVAELMADRSVDPARLAQEVALLASRSDITEEIVRLQGHVKQALGAMKSSKEPVGRKLDFLLQEMHREANTVNAKSEDIEISRDALAIKAEVEKVREQVQNIE